MALRSPSCPFVDFFFWPLWITLNCFRQGPPPPCRADHSRVKQIVFQEKCRQVSWFQSVPRSAAAWAPDLFQTSGAPALPCGSYESETGFVSVTRTDGPPSTTTGAKMLLHFCPVGVTLSWEEAHPGARASRPHKSSRSFGHLLHRNQPAAAPCLCFGRAHAVPAGRAVGCNIAGKLSGNRRDSMRAGRPRSRGGRPDGEVRGIRRATSLKAGLSPLGNSRLPASRAPAPRDWADPSRRTIN